MQSGSCVRCAHDYCFIASVACATLAMVQARQKAKPASGAKPHKCKLREVEMKLIVPPIVIEEGEGFSPEKDIFGRKQFAEELTKLVLNTEGELVIALDAKWGEGKTTFVKMWQGLLADHNITSIYFDAFENDFIEDPLLALSGEIISLIKEPDARNRFKEKAVSAIKIFSRAGARIGIKVLTAGVLDETIFDATDTIKDVSKETSDLADKYIGERLETLKKDKASLEGFRDSIKSAAECLSIGGPLIFIIDELDRCKPTFALDIIERIKHVFSVPKVVFVLVMNRRQLEEVIKIRYGQKVEASLYLQKFVHLWIELPRHADKYSSHGKTYLNKCLADMGFKRTQSNDEAINLYGKLIDHYRLTFRDIERSLANFALVENLSGGPLKNDYYDLLVFLSIIRAVRPETFSKIKQGKIKYEGVGGLLLEADLTDLKDENWILEYGETHLLKLLVKYDLSSEAEAKEITAKLPHDFRIGRPGKMIQICTFWEKFKLT